MLTDFQARHLPNVILPRVSAERPRPLIMSGRNIFADANFIILRGSEQLPAPTLLALLNSAWAWNELAP